MKWLLIFAMLFGVLCAADAAEESLGTKIKKILAPTPTPSPKRKHRKKASPTPSPSPTPKSKQKKPSATPVPEESPSPTSVETPAPSPPLHPASGKKTWPNVSLSPDEVANYGSYLPKVRQIIDAGLALTKQNL